ncbi:hypothetical protein L6164_004680 [Bauhinia variegata]|uniref:Uncharacterized protein n=1 Tax=Bauhinia variegata TaxID=167791 RepID=A0ACB9PRI6_BAUVA|nr:hypothetical protein L6164_004680 [Bauhinia variegata]
MGSLGESFQKRSFFPSIPSANRALPVSNAETTQHEGGLRRRLSSLSLKITATSVSPSSWSFPRSKSLSSMGDYAGTSVRKWWDWGWTWILTRKPVFARDLELNEEETKILGSQNKGSWRHVFYKVRSEIRKILGSDHVLPQTYKYNSFDYSKNFDDGRRTQG